MGHVEIASFFEVIQDHLYIVRGADERLLKVAYKPFLHGDVVVSLPGQYGREADRGETVTGEKAAQVIIEEAVLFIGYPYK